MDSVAFRPSQTPKEVVERIAPQWAKDTTSQAGDWLAYSMRRRPEQLGLALYGLHRGAVHLQHQTTTLKEQSDILRASLRDAENRLMRRNYGVVLAGMLAGTAIFTAVVLYSSRAAVE